MKTIKITSYRSLSIIFAILSTGSALLGVPSQLGGTIQYSKESTLVRLNVVYSGTEVIISSHEAASPKITFEIPKNSDQWHFDVLVTPAKIEYQLKQFPDQEELQNTVDYLKIDPKSNYKYYSLDFADGSWEIKEEKLPETGQIPDRTLIIECYPDWIQEFKGGSAVELPTLYLNNAINNLGLTQEDFKEALVKLELTALDSKIIHSPVRRKTQTISDKKRILIMDSIT